jgi:hypothetical protein
MTHDMYELLCRYRDSGWVVVPVRSGEKRPAIKDWPNRVFDIFDCDPVGNVGIKLGHRSGHLVDVDLDCAEALMLADIYLPVTRAVFGRTSKPRSHRLYVAADAIFEAFVDPISGETLLELRADGMSGGCHQTIVPPSIASGERREWHDDTMEPVVVDARVLRRRCVRLAIGCLTMRYVGETPARNPFGPGWDLPRLLWECDRQLGRHAYEWLKQPAPDARRADPKPRSELSSLEVELYELARWMPNDHDWNGWERMCLAFWATSQGSAEGFIAFDMFSAKHPQYDPRETTARWRNATHSPPDRIGKGTLIYEARRGGWRPGGSHDRAA